VSRGGSGNPRSVTLTREEIEVAEMMGMKKEDYYKHKMALKKEGRIN
jgi:phage I-like protein